MEISNFGMETRPSSKSFHYISASKNINFIINNNDENKDDNTIADVDTSNSEDNTDNTVILHMNTHESFFQHAIKLLHTEIKLKQNKTKI